VLKLMESRMLSVRYKTCSSRWASRRVRDSKR
jgi:hypothetical protein